MLATDFCNTCTNDYQIGGQNFGYQHWFCARLLNVLALMCFVLALMPWPKCVGLNVLTSQGSFWVCAQPTWWRHQMKTFSALLALCARSSRVTGEFSWQRPVTRSFDVFFDLSLNKWLSKRLRRQWFEMPSHSLWCHCNEWEKALHSNIDSHWLNPHPEWSLLVFSLPNNLKLTHQSCFKFSSSYQNMYIFDTIKSIYDL